MALSWHVDSCELRVMVLLQSRGKQQLEESIVVEEEADVYRRSERAKEGEMTRRRREASLRRKDEPLTTSLISPGGACKMYLDTTDTRSSVVSSSWSDMGC